MYDTLELETCSEGSEQSIHGENSYGLCELETCSEASEEYEQSMDGNNSSEDSGFT